MPHLTTRLFSIFVASIRLATLKSDRTLQCATNKQTLCLPRAQWLVLVEMIFHYFLYNCIDGGAFFGGNFFEAVIEVIGYQQGQCVQLVFNH